MTQQMVQDTVYKNEAEFQTPGIFRLAASVVKLPFRIIKGIAAGVLVRFRIFSDTADQFGLPRQRSLHDS